MALIGNRSVLLKSPGRFLSGTVASIERSNFSGAGQLASRFQATDRILGGLPSGHLASSSWGLPRTAGAMASHNDATLSITTTGLAVGGITSTGSSSFAFNIPDVIGGLIASGEGSSSFSFSGTGDLLASLNAEGSASFAITTNNPLLGAEANLIGSSTWSISGSLTPYAIGQMSGSTVDLSVLTADTVATAVWTQVIEAGFTAEQVLRIIAAEAAGAATGLEGADPKFTGLDGTTLRIDGGYAAGTRTIDSLNGS
jgi:hypothetical protein